MDAALLLDLVGSSSMLVRLHSLQGPEIERLCHIMLTLSVLSQVDQLDINIKDICLVLNMQVGARLEVLKGDALQYGAETAAATAIHGAMKRWKLREVPLGPDPLHHRGSSPRKPRITPP